MDEVCERESRPEQIEFDEPVEFLVFVPSPYARLKKVDLTGESTLLCESDLKLKVLFSARYSAASDAHLKWRVWGRQWAGALNEGVEIICCGLGSVRVVHDVAEYEMLARVDLRLELLEIL